MWWSPRPVPTRTVRPPPRRYLIATFSFDSFLLLFGQSGRRELFGSKGAEQNASASMCISQQRIQGDVQFAANRRISPPVPRFKTKPAVCSLVPFNGLGYLQGQFSSLTRTN